MQPKLTQTLGSANLHAVIVGHSIADGVNSDVSHVESAGRVRKHGEHVHGLLVGHITLFLEELFLTTCYIPLRE